MSYTKFFNSSSVRWGIARVLSELREQLEAYGHLPKSSLPHHPQYLSTYLMNQETLCVTYVQLTVPSNIHIEYTTRYIRYHGWFIAAIAVIIDPLPEGIQTCTCMFTTISAITIPFPCFFSCSGDGFSVGEPNTITPEFWAAIVFLACSGGRVSDAQKLPNRP